MRVTWMIPAVLVVASSSVVASAQGPMVPGESRGSVERPRHERLQPERPGRDVRAERHLVLRSERFRSRGEVEGGGSAASAVATKQGSFQSATTKAAPLSGSLGNLRARGDVEGKGRQQSASGLQSTNQTGQVGSFRSSPRLSSVATNRIRCAEGDASCGSVSREAPVKAPQATGGSAKLMKAADAISKTRDSFAKSRDVLMGKISRAAMFCAIADSEACNKLPVSPRIRPAAVGERRRVTQVSFWRSSLRSSWARSRTTGALS